MRSLSRILVVGAIAALSFMLPVQADQTDPNGSTSQPEPGWSLWRPNSDIQNADFTAGFSNIELGGFLDFENSCAQALGTPTEKTPYWFRVSNLVNQIGTGTAEYGCWKNGQFVTTHSSTAVSTKLGDVSCLRVNVPTGKGLRIRSEPELKAKVIGFVRNGATVKIDSSPALIRQADGRNWVAISSPIEGWVSNDRPDTPGNLGLCR